MTKISPKEDYNRLENRMDYTVTPADVVHPDHQERDIALSQLEKESRENSAGLDTFRGPLLSLLDSDEMWTTRMHIARLLGRISWSGDDRTQVTEYLFRQARGANKFAAAWALDALAHLALTDESIQSQVIELACQGLEGGSAAVRVRARHCLARLGLVSWVASATHET